MSLADAPAGLTIERAASPDPHVAMLIAELDGFLALQYPPEQRLGLSLDALFEPHVRVFVAHAAGAAAGCAGVALLDGFAEVKRMYVRPDHRGGGAAGALLARLEQEALGAGLATLRLQTGSFQLAAQRFYAREGFALRPAFGAYLAMTPAALATSLFYEKRLA